MMTHSRDYILFVGLIQHLYIIFKNVIKHISYILGYLEVKCTHVQLETSSKIKKVD